jgi:prepilin-type N-terminal cleavage/methylation domain-containing protein
MISDTRGFTLVELLVVIAILAGVAAAAVGMYSRSQLGERAPAFARGLLQAVHEARQSALSLSQTTRLTFVSGIGGWVNSQYLQPGTANTWLALASTRVPDIIEICQAQAGPQLAATTVTCGAGQTTRLCFAPSGAATLSTDGVCPGAGAGATFYLRTAEGTLVNVKHYKLVVWGLTGLPKLVDTW